MELQIKGNRDLENSLGDWQYTKIMGKPTPPSKALLILVSFSRYKEALQWAAKQASLRWGEPLLESEILAFTETDYYGPQMGEDLLIKLTSFVSLIGQDQLAEIKLSSNDFEVEYSKLYDHPEERPLNLDPGYLTPAKFVLASTKDASHRLYIGQGIFAEITLTFSHGKWRTHEWTYPNYKREDYHEFLTQCRDQLLAKERDTRP